MPGCERPTIYGAHFQAGQHLARQHILDEQRARVRQQCQQRRGCVQLAVCVASSEGKRMQVRRAARPVIGGFQADVPRLRACLSGT